MSVDKQIGARRGMVVSDLHLFARRSRGEARLQSIHAQLGGADVLVLNGDIFDFRWSTLGNLEQTLPSAIDWLHSLLDRFPRCDIHYVIGNHDCVPAFLEALTELAISQPRFCWHEYSLQIGPQLFLHGDCAHYEMGSQALKRYREAWQEDRRWPPVLAIAYEGLDRFGITRRAHDWQFPRQRTTQRIARYLDDACPNWRATTQDCYFGHTHLPFTHHEHEGIRFHNTGAAIHDQEFNPLSFTISSDPIEADYNMDKSATLPHSPRLKL